MNAQKNLRSRGRLFDLVNRSWPIDRGPARRVRRRLSIEQLEDRCLLSVAIVNHSSNLYLVSPAPPSVEPRDLDSKSAIFAFQERQLVFLPTATHVDITTAGTYSNFNSLSPSTLPAGTIVDSLFLQSSTLANAPTGVTLKGFVTFAQPILGLLVLDNSLNNTDGILGSAGTLYPTGTLHRGFENDGDSLTLSADKHTLSITIAVGEAGDQLRVIVNAAIGSGINVPCGVVGESSNLYGVSSPPPSVQPGDLESKSAIFAFQERQMVTLSTNTNVDITRPGTYSNFGSLSPGAIPAGTVVDSYFIHSSTLANAPNGVRLKGFVTFAQPILGLLVLDNSLNNTDGILGSAGTLYPTGTLHRGFENDGDSLTLSADKRTVFIAIAVAEPGDQLRVLTSASPSWVEQGPGPIQFNFSVPLPPNNEAAGAIEAIATSPNNPNLVYAGSVNGGIWKTTDATAPEPVWTSVTDQQLPALSINSLAISPLDSNTLFAGTGSVSSDGFEGSDGFGIARSTDGGSTWYVLASATFLDRRIRSIVPTSLTTLTGQVILAATLFDRGGVFRSSDGGVTFTQLSRNPVSGLPRAGVSDLVPDPGNANRFYAAVPAAFGGGSNAGVYRSDDGGQTWTSVSSGLTDRFSSLRILLAVHNSPGNNVIYAAVINTSGGLDGVFRSTDQGVSWTAMGVPSPPIFPGGQGNLHGAIAADPANPNVVFIGGDTQLGPFPNANGANGFIGNVFRGDASLLPGNPWQNVVANGAHGTGPHADSRAMVFDANGNLLEASDGGIARLVSPDNPANRHWVSVNGNLRTAEFHSVAYNSLDHTIIGGTQDNGTPYQSAPASFPWQQFGGGDGGNVAVDANQTAHAGTALLYESAQHLRGFSRLTVNASNNLVGFAPIGLNITSGPGAGLTLLQYDPRIGFYNPFVLHALDKSRMLIGTANLYESFDRGDSLNDLAFLGQQVGNSGGASPIAYGGRLGGIAYPDVFYVGTSANPGAPVPRILHRVTLGGPITTLSAYPGSSPLSLVIDPLNYRHVFVLDDQSHIWASLDEGGSWINLTLNLNSLSMPLDFLGSARVRPRTIEIVDPDGVPGHTVLVAGGLGGVFELPNLPGARWTALGCGFPHALVLDLHYDYTDRVLVAGTLGRGAWTVTRFFPGGGPAGASATVTFGSSNFAGSFAALAAAPFEVTVISQLAATGNPSVVQGYGAATISPTTMAATANVPVSASNTPRAGINGRAAGLNSQALDTYFSIHRDDLGGGRYLDTFGPPF
jgi:hypothetical protein